MGVASSVAVVVAGNSSTTVARAFMPQALKTIQVQRGFGDDREF